MRFFGPIQVPAGQYFVMGDNRDESGDSRVFGFVPEDSIAGRVTAVAASVDPSNHYLPRWRRFLRTLPFRKSVFPLPFAADSPTAPHGRVSSSLRAALVLPGGCSASRRLLAPARRAPRLLRPRPSSASRGGAPRCPQDDGVTDTPPRAARWGPRSLRSHGRSTRRADLPPTRPLNRTVERSSHEVILATVFVPCRSVWGASDAGAAGGKSLRSPRAPDA